MLNSEEHPGTGTGKAIIGAAVAADVMISSGVTLAEDKLYKFYGIK